MNVLNDNWLFVRYNTGKVKQISVRQAFKDAEKIKDIETPTFHGTTVSLYDVPVIQFLSILVLSAYFKPKNKFKASGKFFNKKLTEDGWDLKVIEDYFNKWEKRFNLFDDKYPFLQDIRLKEEIKEKADNSFIGRSNLLAPANNNLVFEHITNSAFDINEFVPSIDELIYILLYTRSLGTSSMFAQYPYKAMASNATMFILNKGKNLKETIIANCLPLRDSNTDGFYDRPIWELDSLEDITKFDLENMYKNTLICTYFLYPIYIQYEDDTIKDIIVARSIPQEIEVDENGKKIKKPLVTNYDIYFNSETRKALMDAYSFYNPWTIKRYKEEKDIGSWGYKEWDNSIKLTNLCIEITKHTPEGCGCNLINSDLQANENVNNTIYYREYDGQKSNVLSFGKYNIEKGILSKLQNEKNHEKAQEFQNMLDKIQNKFYIFKDSELTGSSLKDCKFAFSKFAENYFFTTFVSNITKKDCVDKATEAFVEESKKLVKRLEVVTNNPLKYAQAYRMFCGSLNKLKEGT